MNPSAISFDLNSQDEESRTENSLTDNKAPANQQPATPAVDNQPKQALHRRSFLQKAGVIGVSSLALSAWLPRMAFASSPDNRSSRDVLVCVFLRGGQDGLSAVVPYTDANYHDNRPRIRVPDDKVIDLDGQFGLHPAMAPLHEIWQQQDLAFVHAIGSPHQTRSHFDAMDYMERGTPGEKQLHSGWIARHLQQTAQQSDSPFRAIGMGNMLQQSLRGADSTLAMKSITDFHLKGRKREALEAQRALQQLYSFSDGESANGSATTSDPLTMEAASTFEAIQFLKEANPQQYAPQHGATYANNGLGKGLRQTAQLIRAEIGLEVACVDAGGWDTHAIMGDVNQGKMRNLLSVLAQNLNAFYTDMQDQMANITVVVMSEFGRRLAENGNGGLDHGTGGLMYLMGGGIAGGAVHGSWPGLAPEALHRGDLAVANDYRDVLGEVIAERLDNSATSEVFPNHTVAPLGVTTDNTVSAAAQSPLTRRAETEKRLTEELFLPLVNP